MSGVSIEELLMSLASLRENMACAIQHVHVTAISETSQLIPRLNGSRAADVALRNAQDPYTAADVLPQLVALRTLDAKLHHLPSGFFVSLPTSLETLRLCLPTPLSPGELDGIQRLRNLRQVALTHDASTAAALRRALPPGCQLSHLN